MKSTSSAVLPRRRARKSWESGSLAMRTEVSSGAVRLPSSPASLQILLRLVTEMSPQKEWKPGHRGCL